MYGPPKNSMKGSGMEMSPLQKSVVELVDISRVCAKCHGKSP